MPQTWNMIQKGLWGCQDREKGPGGDAIDTKKHLGKYHRHRMARE